MEGIQHRYLQIRGLKLHVAEIGEGPAVVFIHGFPEIWYSWRHQMLACSMAGYRAISFDIRGYGLSEQPPEPETSSTIDIVHDTIAILDTLCILKAFVVGKDFGAEPAYLLGLFHPDRISGVVNLGLPYLIPLIPIRYSSDYTFSSQFPKGFYVLRWQEPGRAEADFGRFDVKTVIKNIYIMFSGTELPVAGSEDKEIMDIAHPSDPLPSWFSEDDLNVYADLYKNSGFRFPLQVPYRCFERNYREICSGDRRDFKIKVPTLFIMGKKNYVIKLPGLQDIINANMKEYFSDLETIMIEEGSHFVQEQFPDQINQLLITFINKKKGE